MSTVELRRNLLMCSERHIKVNGKAGGQRMGHVSGR